MGAFTAKQEEILQAANRTTLSYVSGVHEVLHEHITRFTTLMSLLVTKGLVNLEEFEAAKKEVEAGQAVEIALSPELERLNEQLNRLIREAGLAGDEGED